VNEQSTRNELKNRIFKNVNRSIEGKYDSLKKETGMKKSKQKVRI
jgi:hypothetical protein